jgi:hypothetical protein
MSTRTSSYLYEHLRDTELADLKIDKVTYTTYTSINAYHMSTSAIISLY